MCRAATLHLYWPEGQGSSSGGLSAESSGALVGWWSESPCGCLHVLVAAVNAPPASLLPLQTASSEGIERLAPALLGEYRLKEAKVVNSQMDSECYVPRSLSCSSRHSLEDSNLVQQMAHGDGASCLEASPLVNTGGGWSSDGEGGSGGRILGVNAEYGEEKGQEESFGTRCSQRADRCKFPVVEQSAFVLKPAVHGSKFWMQVEGAVLRNTSTGSVGNFPVNVTLRVGGQTRRPLFKVILYEQPQYGRSHYSFFQWSPPTYSWGVPSQQLKRPSLEKLPPWLAGLAPPVAMRTGIMSIFSNINVTFADHPFQNRRPASIPMKVMAATFAAGCALIHVLSGAWLFALAQFRFFRNWLPLPNLLRALELRCEEIRSWPMSFSPQPQASTGEPLPTDVAAYHSSQLLCYSPLMSLLADTFLGFVAGSLLLLNYNAAAAWLHDAGHALMDNILRTGVTLLMDEPAGIKLNTELVKALGTLSWQIIELGAWVVTKASCFLQPAVSCLAVLAPLWGFAASGAFWADLISLVTFQVTALYCILATLYHHQLRVVASLWRFFMGRKWNPLQDRTESVSASVEQIVVASLLFTIAVLLLPTTSIFYIFFATVYMLSRLVSLGLLTTAAAVRAFPFYSVALWLFRPGLFPSGIFFQPVDLCPLVDMNTGIVHIKSLKVTHNELHIPCGVDESGATVEEQGLTDKERSSSGWSSRNSEATKNSVPNHENLDGSAFATRLSWQLDMTERYGHGVTDESSHSGEAGRRLGGETKERAPNETSMGLNCGVNGCGHAAQYLKMRTQVASLRELLTDARQYLREPFSKEALSAQAFSFASGKWVSSSVPFFKIMRGPQPEISVTGYFRLCYSIFLEGHL